MYEYEFILQQENMFVNCYGLFYEFWLFAHLYNFIAIEIVISYTEINEEKDVWKIQKYNGTPHLCQQWICNWRRTGLILCNIKNILNTKPLEVDLLVIKKDPDIQITNEIGKLFRGHNIIEYKSPLDHLNIDTFLKRVHMPVYIKSMGRL